MCESLEVEGMDEQRLKNCDSVCVSGLGRGSPGVRRRSV